LVPPAAAQSSTQHTPTGLPSVFIVGAARTPVGSFQGMFSKLSAVNLGVAAVEGVLAQAGVKPDQVEDLYFGNVLQGNVGQSPARQVVIGSGMPESTEATTINKVSGRGTRWGWGGAGREGFRTGLLGKPVGHQADC
jgi:acetyl-CoA C-acetyltransferase